MKKKFKDFKIHKNKKYKLKKVLKSVLKKT